jgi:hypothetical protein
LGIDIYKTLNRPRDFPITISGAVASESLRETGPSNNQHNQFTRSRCELVLMIESAKIFR